MIGEHFTHIREKALDDLEIGVVVESENSGVASMAI